MINIRLLTLAINAASPNSYISLDTQGAVVEDEFVHYWDFDRSSVIAQEDGTYTHGLIAGDTPETILIRTEQERLSHEAYNQLSDEAKQLMKLLLNAPAEIMSVIATKKHKRISKRRVLKMLSKQWGDRRYAKKVVAELVAFVRTF